MTPAELALIEARADAATEGPWEFRGEQYIVRQDKGRSLATIFGEDEQQANGLFIAHARSDVPKLIERIRELEADQDRRYLDNTQSAP